jgi:hypothetical protein
MNGWWLHPYNKNNDASFKIPDNITPIFVSFHIANDKLYDNPNIGESELRGEIAQFASYPENIHSPAINLRREMRTLLINTSNDVK